MNTLIKNIGGNVVRLRLLTSRKAVSPIISAILLIVIVVFSFSFLSLSLQNWISNEKRGNVKEIQERVVVEDIHFILKEGERTRVTLFVRNVGLVEVVIIGCLVNEGRVFSSMITEELEVLPSYGAKIDLELRWEPDTVYEFVLSTLTGRKVTAIETA